MKVKDIVRNDFIVQGDIETDISGIKYDSRKINHGDMFVAVKGENFDGHDFIADAIKKGAVAVIYEKDMLINQHKGERKCHSCEGRNPETKELDSRLHGNDGLGVFSGENNSLLVTRYSLLQKYPHIVWIGVDDSRDAIAFAASKFYGNPSEKMTVIGITGTNGKTTTSYLIKSTLEHYGRNVGLIGTIKYMIKDEIYDAPHTTPESPDFQSLLRTMADMGCDFVVSEVSSHALSQKRADYTAFRAAVFTNLTRDHLDFHHTIEDYFLAKKRLLTVLLIEGGAAVVNIDDLYGESLADTLKNQNKIKNKKIFTYGIKNKSAGISAFDIKTTFKGMTFKVKIGQDFQTQDAEFEISSPLVGDFNVYNILSAICVLLSLNIPINIIKEGIAMTGLVKGRFEKIDLGQDFLAVVDYAHTEDALERLLMTAHQLLEAYRFAEKTEAMMNAKKQCFSAGEKKLGGKVITVFGCGGNRDKGKRSKMGEIAASLSDFVIITSDNPRSEPPRSIIRDIERGIKGDNYIVIPDRDVAIGMAVELASSGDIVLVAGKGHEEYQEINGKRYDFSDKTALENAIKRTISRPSFGGGTTGKGAEMVRC
jgi:UDP-N-acetylmuramoyl-L-alanyl-D-glutamate--2,6-diaminopimelate ligase